MKLLVVTQAVDTRDPVLGFFHQWLEELATRFESIEVICLREGEHTLPTNVRVHSLGKGQGRASRLTYSWRFLRLVWCLRSSYDAVFVHMNQEYVLLAGWLWRLSGKSIYLWYNHYAGSWATDIAAALSTHVFCTSKHSYTAKYERTMLMPIGVDTDRFIPDARIVRVPHSILFLARMSRSKRPEMLIDALALLAGRGIDCRATFVGSPRPEDEGHYARLKERVHDAGLESRATFLPGVPNTEVPDLYRAHEIFVNCSPSGMFDKTLFEAAAVGCRVLAVSEDFAALAGPESHFSSAAELADRLEAFLTSHEAAVVPAFVERNSLTVLVDRLAEGIAPAKRSYAWIALALVVLSLPLHFAALGYGLPLALVGDEFTHIATAFQMLAGHTLRATSSVSYLPPLLAYLSLPFIALTLAAKFLFGGLHSVQVLQQFAILHSTSFIVITRLIAGLFSLAFLFFLFQLTKRLFGRPTALIAVVLAAFDFQLVHESQLGHFWIPEVCFIVASFWALERLYTTGASRWYITAAVTIGLGYGMGYIAILLVPFAVLFHFYSPHRNYKSGLWALGTLVALIAAFSWLNPVSFFHQFGRSIAIAASALHTPLVLEGAAVHGNATVAATLELLLNAIWLDNPLVVLLALMGGVFLAWRKQFFALSILVGFPVVYLLMNAAVFNNPDYRYILPVLPFLILLAGYALACVWEVARERRVWHGAAVVLGVAALAYSLVGSVSYSLLLTTHDTRMVARTWIGEHIDPGAYILIDAQYLTVEQDTETLDWLAERGLLDTRATLIRSLSPPEAPSPRFTAYYPAYFGGNVRTALDTLRPQWYIRGNYAYDSVPQAGYTLVTTFPNGPAGCVQGDDAFGNPVNPLATLSLRNLGPCVQVYERAK